MDIEQILKINELTKEFYLKKTDEFSSTRQNPWGGWEIMSTLFKGEFGNKKSINILDLGCGNLRFEKYISSILSSVKINVLAVDSCENLVDKHISDSISVIYKNLDIISALAQNNFINALSLQNSLHFDLCVSFGVMHHIPTRFLRQKYLDELSNVLHNNGILAISFWQFLNDKKIQKKADIATQNAQILKGPFDLETGDYFLNWAGDSEVFRFCHNFSDDELYEIKNYLVSNNNLVLTDSFKSDGKTKNLNEYQIYKFSK